ncbi:hypothetical protein PG996_000595 [Apiospora saccharicola]|uniref:Uncharacterized protein n=1 Tax=Apiospora saccharicola TaxID=335842 RepID=A0ABR1WI25_9PEZI
MLVVVYASVHGSYGRGGGGVNDHTSHGLKVAVNARSCHRGRPEGGHGCPGAAASSTVAATAIAAQEANGGIGSECHGDKEKGCVLPDIIPPAAAH